MGNKFEEISHIEHERYLDFTHSFGNEGFFEEGVIRAMERMASLCGIFFGEACANSGFDHLVRGVFPNHGEGATWSDILDEEFSSIFSETPIGQLMHDLTAYADYGIVLTATADMAEREALLEQQVGTAERLLECLPVQQWNLDGERLIKLIQKAIARWKVDSGRPINAEELAVLSGRALQTIKNKLAGQPTEITGNQRRIEAREASAWLSVQRDFRTSIWREQEAREAISGPEEKLGRVLFLPVAKDGSVFHPGINREGKYLIDDEGRERAIEDFEDALATLQRALIPQWRRPTEEGVWTRVRGVEWRRYSVEEIFESAPVSLHAASAGA